MEENKDITAEPEVMYGGTVSLPGFVYKSALNGANEMQTDVTTYVGRAIVAYATNGKTDAYAQLLCKLSDFQEYEQGWDGGEALPICKSVVRNTKSVLKSCKTSVLQQWTLFPEKNGTILIKYLNGNAGINIGENRYSYYRVKNGEISGQNDLEFSVDNMCNLMESISE